MDDYNEWSEQVFRTAMNDSETVPDPTENPRSEAIGSYVDRDGLLQFFTSDDVILAYEDADGEVRGVVWADQDEAYYDGKLVQGNCVDMYHIEVTHDEFIDGTRAYFVEVAEVDGECGIGSHVALPGTYSSIEDAYKAAHSYVEKLRVDEKELVRHRMRSLANQWC